MLKNFDFDHEENPYFDWKRSQLGEQLATLQRQLKGMNRPLLIIIDGWESSGKGYVIREIIQELDPRAYKVSTFESPTDEEKSRPFLWRFWSKLPRRGNIAVFDRSFYFNVMNDPDIDAKDLKRDIHDIGSIEKELISDGMLVLKFFLHQKQKTQKKRIELLRKDPNRSFWITERDEKQYNDYGTFFTHFDSVLRASDFSYSPWNIVSSEDLKDAAKKILGLTIQIVQTKIKQSEIKNKSAKPFKRTYQAKDEPLSKIDLNLRLTEEEYSAQIKQLQQEAQDLANQLYIKGIPSILVFEGMDAAGKGGAIQRLTKLMDPRGYEVIPVSAPDQTEQQYHYLWRFYRDLPGKGKMKIFDRSWYGRVLVERVEGLAEVVEWDRAYNEINQMEKHLANFGTSILKFFLYIDKDEQLARFQDREQELDKLYKITEEDWRNREKWDDYIKAMNEMLVRTHTKHAPWIIIEGKDKKFARVKVLQEFISQVRVRLKQ